MLRCGGESNAQLGRVECSVGLCDIVKLGFDVNGIRFTSRACWAALRSPPASFVDKPYACLLFLSQNSGKAGLAQRTGQPGV